MNRLIYTALALLGLITSCRREEQSTSTYYVYLDSRIKSYQFKQGSYWVFENDSTKEIASIIVTGVDHDFFWQTPSVHGQPGTKAEYYQINLKSFITSHLYNDYLSSNHIRRNGGGGYGQLGQPIFLADGNIGEEFNGMEVVDTSFPLNLHGNNFDSVDKIKITAANQYQHEFDYDTYLYYTDSVGMIKKETMLPNGTVESWSLKRWNVLK